MIHKLYKIVEGLNARFPAGDDPFMIITRLAEECGEVAAQVNHFERQGVKAAKLGAPDRAGFAKELQDVIRATLHLALHYGLEDELAESVDAYYQRVVQEELVRPLVDTIHHAPADYACPFCLLVRGVREASVLSLQSDILYHDRAVTALIGSHQWPNNHGNVLVVPNEHYENLYELPLHYAADIQRVAQMVALAQKGVYRCAGVSTRQHNEPAGNQDVWHYHLHVTPRYHNDQFYGSQRAFMPAEERAEHAGQLRAWIAGQLELGGAQEAERC